MEDSSKSVIASCHRFANQTVFAPVSEPLAIFCEDNLAFIATNDLQIIVHNLKEESAPEIIRIRTCGQVKLLSYSVIGNFIITLELSGKANQLDRAVRCYVNWEACNNSQPNRVRLATVSRQLSDQMSHEKFSSPIEETVQVLGMETLEIVHMPKPTYVSAYYSKESIISKPSGTAWAKEMFAVSENTAVHVYRGRMVLTKISGPIIFKKPCKDKIDRTDYIIDCFQHLYTLNFNFVVTELDFKADYLAVISYDQFQIVHIIATKENLEKESYEMKNSSNNFFSIQNEECFLPCISSARRLNRTKPQLKVKEIFGPVKQLDTAHVTLLKQVSSMDVCFKTVAYRKFNLSVGNNLHSVSLFPNLATDEIGALVSHKHEAFQYSLSTAEYKRSASYPCTDEILKVCMSDNNLVHICTEDALYTTSSRLGTSSYSEKIFQILSVTVLGKQHFMGASSVCPWSEGVLVCTKMIISDSESSSPYADQSCWNLYALRQHTAEQIKVDMMILCSEYESESPTSSLQIFAESLLLMENSKYDQTPTGIGAGYADPKSVIAASIQRLLQMCYRVGGKYETVGEELILNAALSCDHAIDVLRELSSQNFDVRGAIYFLVKRRLIGVNLNIDQEIFIWIFDHLLEISQELLFEFILSNNFEEYLQEEISQFSLINCEESEMGHLLLTVYSTLQNDLDRASYFYKQISEDFLCKNLMKWSHLLMNDGNITRFGLYLAGVDPHLLFNVINDTSLTNGLKLFQSGTFKKLGDCSYVLFLESLIERIANRELNADVELRDLSAPFNELIQLNHQLIQQPSAFCLHKASRSCQKVPNWLVHHRLGILNLFSPFNGSDPFKLSHQFQNSNCVCVSCCSYLIRLQSLLSWGCKQSTTKNEIVEFKDNFLYLSLLFILAHELSVENSSKNDSRVEKVMRFILESGRTKESDWLTLNRVNIADRYLHEYCEELSPKSWSNVISICKRINHTLYNIALNLASQILPLNSFQEVDINDDLSAVASERNNTFTSVDWIEVTAKRRWNERLFSKLIRDLESN